MTWKISSAKVVEALDVIEALAAVAQRGSAGSRVERTGRSGRPSYRSSRGSRGAGRRRAEKFQLPVNHHAGNLAGCRRDPLTRKPCRQFLEPRPVFGLQRNFLNLRCPFQGRASTCRANPRLQLTPQRVHADRRAVNGLSGDDILGPQRLGNQVRANQTKCRTGMPNCGSGAARDRSFGPLNSLIL